MLAITITRASAFMPPASSPRAVTGRRPHFAVSHTASRYNYFYIDESFDDGGAERSDIIDDMLASRRRRHFSAAPQRLIINRSLLLFIGSRA